MGTASSKSSNSKWKSSTTNDNVACCCTACFDWICLTRPSSNVSSASSSFYIDDKYLPTFDRLSVNQKSEISSNDRIRPVQINQRRYQMPYLKSIENLEKSLHGTASIDQWINSLPILGTPSLNRANTDGNASIQVDLWIETENELPNNDFFSNLSSIKESRVLLDRIKKSHLNFYCEEFRHRLKCSKFSKAFVDHFTSSTIIYPSVAQHQTLTRDLVVHFSIPAESILPILSMHPNSSYRIHEQTRAKCYFVPSNFVKIDSISETEQKSESNECRWVYSSDLRTGSIRVDRESIPNDLSSFVNYSSKDQCWQLSSNAVHQWFHRLILVNQTCAIVKRFLTGDGSHLTCLLINDGNVHSDFSSLSSTLTFAALRLPLCSYLTNSLEQRSSKDGSDSIVDAFFSTFLSDRCRTSNQTIYIDYEDYSFGLFLDRWPQAFVDNFQTDPTRSNKRRWPNVDQLQQCLNTHLLLTPILHSDQWQITFDLVEQKLFELMNESTLLIYGLCQQIFSRTVHQRQLIKHCFFNYLEQFDAPFQSQRTDIRQFLNRFLQHLREQAEKQEFPHYFNHRINLYDRKENYIQWLKVVEQSFHRSISPASLFIKSNLSIKAEFLFQFINQLYQTFHHQRSQFHLNDQVLLDLHQQLCKNLSIESNGNCTSHSLLLEQIQKQLSLNFETNAELVHNCLNQIRKAQTSLIFHYTWTIYMQYLHTYYNVLWKISDDSVLIRFQ